MEEKSQVNQIGQHDIEGTEITQGTEANVKTLIVILPLLSTKKEKEKTPHGIHKINTGLLWGEKKEDFEPENVLKSLNTTLE